MLGVSSELSVLWGAPLQPRLGPTWDGTDCAGVGWGCMLGVICGWGAASLPSLPVGGRAGSGARVQRTGSSCGPWGPWRAAARSWGDWLSPARLYGAAGGACCAEEEGEHCPRTQEKSRAPRGERARAGRTGQRCSPAAPGSATPGQSSGSLRLSCALPVWGAGLWLSA